MSKFKKGKFDIAVIAKVTEYRIAQGLTQDDLAALLGVTRGYIGQIESPNSPSVYKVRDLNLLATEFNCSPKNFIPENTIDEENE